MKAPGGQGPGALECVQVPLRLRRPVSAHSVAVEAADLNMEVSTQQLVSTAVAVV